MKSLQRNVLRILDRTAAIRHIQFENKSGFEPALAKKKYSLNTDIVSTKLYLSVRPIRKLKIKINSYLKCKIHCKNQSYGFWIRALSTLFKRI